MRTNTGFIGRLSESISRKIFHNNFIERRTGYVI
jgi:hypothetical protein